MPVVRVNVLSLVWNNSKERDLASTYPKHKHWSNPNSRPPDYGLQNMVTRICIKSAKAQRIKLLKLTIVSVIHLIISQHF